MISGFPDHDLTRDADLVDWQAFCLAYYEPILRALRLLRVPEGDVDELAHSFLLKAAEKKFLDAFRSFQEREAQAGRRARFRTYLYRSLQNHANDAYRRSTVRSREQPLTDEFAESVVADAERSLDPDALYALDVLHQSLQALRRHCERTGKPHYWVFFEETFLADEFRGRVGRPRAELLAAYPGRDPRFFDNALTTAKRAFRRFVQDVIPRGLREGETAAERFAEWMAILRESNASQFNLLHMAFRTSPIIRADNSQAFSEALVVDARPPETVYEPPALAPGDDEMSILLSFRMELPLTEMLDVAEIQRHVPPSSPLWPSARRGPGPGGAGAPPRPSRPLCLMTLIDPTPAEAEALARIDLLGALGRLKSLSKQLRRRPDPGVPEVYAQLLYTIVSLLAMLRCQAELHTIGASSLAGNVRWFLKQSWLDDRLRPVFDEGLALLEGRHVPGSAVAET